MKLNSHRWFFNAFYSSTEPERLYTTKFSSTSIYHLWNAFARDLSIRGTCREI